MALVFVWFSLFVVDKDSIFDTVVDEGIIVYSLFNIISAVLDEILLPSSKVSLLLIEDCFWLFSIIY